MPFDRPPASACWRHQGLRSGFEVAYFSPRPGGFRVEGTTTGIQDGGTWVVGYTLDIGSDWNTRYAHIRTRTVLGTVERRVELDDAGLWLVDGVLARHLDGCRDVDLEASAFTNALPVHRLGLGIGESATAPAAYVQLESAEVERLEQSYTRIEDERSRERYAYEAPVFDFSCTLTYDGDGLVLDYPGIATREG